MLSIVIFFAAIWILKTLIEKFFDWLDGLKIQIKNKWNQTKEIVPDNMKGNNDTYPYWIWDLECTNGCKYNLRSRDKLWILHAYDFEISDDAYCPKCGRVEKLIIGECAKCKCIPIWGSHGDAGRSHCPHFTKSRGCIAFYEPRENTLKLFDNPKPPIRVIG